MNTKAKLTHFSALFVALVTFTSPALAANIVPLTESDAFRTYIDLDTITKLNSREKTFRTIDNVKVAASPMASNVIVWKINCTSARMQALRMTSYTDLFGRGQVLRDYIGEIPGYNGGPAIKMEELNATGNFRPHLDRVCVTEPVQSSTSLPVEDIKCSKTAFFAAVLRDPANPSKPLPALGNLLHKPAGAAMVAIVDKSTQGKSLPKWLKPNEWIADESMINADCVKWSNSEWYLRDVFWPHNAPDGNGFIAINLTQGGAYFILARDISMTERTITHTIGPDPKAVSALRAGFEAPFDPGKSPRSCYFAPDRPVCKQ